MASNEKAYLDICEPNPSSGADPGAQNQRTPGSKLASLEFQFNPEKLSIKKTAKWDPGQQAGASTTPVPAYESPGPIELTIPILLDAAHSKTNDINADIDVLLSCLVPTSKSRTDGKPHPPLVIFGWGTKLSLTAWVRTVDTEYQLFQPNGVPTRAKCSVTLVEYPTATRRQNPTSGGTATHTVRTLRAGDTLASVAFDEYGDAALWRGLAAANRISDPLRAAAGDELLIPPADEVEALS